MTSIIPFKVFGTDSIHIGTTHAASAAQAVQNVASAHGLDATGQMRAEAIIPADWNRYTVTTGVSELDVFIPADTDLDGKFVGWDHDMGEFISILGWLCEINEVEEEYTVAETETHEYLFDLKLYASLRVTATSEAEARKMIQAELHCAETNFGSWPNGDPILGEVSPDGEPDLMEVDGEDPMVADEPAYIREHFEEQARITARHDFENACPRCGATCCC